MNTGNHTTEQGGAPTGELELVVRREYSLLTPSYHVTVASTGPVQVQVAFDLQARDGLAAVAETAMNRLRSRGYRLTGPMSVHDTYVTAPLVLDEREAATIELAADLGADVRAVVRSLPAMGTREGAQETLRLLGDVLAGAQALQARANAVLSSDEAVEAAAILDDAMAVVEDGGQR